MSPSRKRARSKKTRRPTVTLPARAGSNGLSGDLRADIPHLVDLLKRHGLAELEWECEGFRIRLRREGSASPMVVAMDSAPASAEAPLESRTAPAQNDTSGKVTIASPIVGTFYRSPSPDADAYVEEGDLVKKGQVLCIVEAMKLMNEIESEMDGRIVKILAESTKPVEYGQPLFLLDPESAG